MSRAERISFFLIASLFLLVGVSGLTTPFITVLFAYLALSFLDGRLNRPWLSVLIFSILVIGIFVGLIFFSRHAVKALPHVASTSIPLVIDFLRDHGWDELLPFDDPESMKFAAVNFVKSELTSFAHYFNIMSREFISLIVGLVVGASLFFNSELDLDKERHLKRNNLYSAICREVSIRFGHFYQSFATVMGAQVMISSINTFFTGIYVLCAQIPHGSLIVVLTFMCGMLPIVGNLISNSIIFMISLTLSVNEAISALIFLIVLHKFEYFLNSKIIGSRIRNPMWLTLLSLVVGEKLMGIPGMIVAPVLLNYIKVETSSFEGD